MLTSEKPLCFFVQLGGYQTQEEAKQDVFKYIELYYNRQRMHSSIGHSAPCDLERDVD